MSLYVRLNAEYPTDDEFIEAGPMPELLYIRALCFCKRKLIDGTISAKQLPAVAMGIPTAKRHAKTLVDVGLWEETSEGWAITGWLKWNKSANQVEEDREVRRVASLQANHQQHHVGEGKKPSTRCELCREGPSDSSPIPAPKSDPSTDPDSLRSRLPKPEPEPEPEEKPEPEPEESFGTSFSSSNLDPGEPATKRNQIIEAIVTIRADRQPRGTGWRKTVRADVAGKHGSKLDDWLQRFPHAPVDVIAAALETGESRNLAMFTPTSSPPLPTERLTREQREAVISQAKETA